jgi:hypothetical protein
MKKIKAVYPVSTLAVSILGLAMAAIPSWAATAPPAMTLAITGASVAFDSTGTITYGGACNASACPSSVIVGNGSNGFNAGQIVWFGTIGTLTGSIEGQSKPALTAPEIDILVSQLSNTGTAAASLTISWTDVGFTVGESPSTMNVTTNGVGTVSYTSYVDNTNAPFGTGTTVATVATGGGVGSGSGPTASPFSMTNVETVTLPASSGVLSSDFSLHVAPHPPLALSCTGLAAGTVGTAYSAVLSATGGVPAYTFSIGSGSISPLALNPTTGAITGTPSAPGTLTFTAKVTDSSGSTASNTASASCSIIVTTPKTTPPLKVTCPTSSATVGTYYNSTVGVTGGVPPYKYSIAFGTLPAGLTLNASTGAITGTPTTAETGAFKIEVTDSTGAVAYTNCSGTCSGGVNVTYGGSTPQSGYGDKGNSCNYSSNGIPLTCYGYSNNGSACDLYSSNNSGGPCLGLKNYSNSNQIDNQHFVQFDISSHNSLGATGTSINVSSTESYATFDVYGSNTKGALGTQLCNNVQACLSGYQSIPNANNYKYLCVKGHQGDVAVACLQFTYTCACAIDVATSKGSGCYTSNPSNDWWCNNGSNGSSGSSGWGDNNGGYGGYSGWGGSGGSGSYGSGGNSGSGQGTSPGQCGW